MQIIHRIDDFFLELFPKVRQANNDVDILKEEVTRYYSYGAYKPIVNIEDGWIRIDIDTPTILRESEDYNRVVNLCEKGKYNDAKKLLLPLLEKNPTNSEYHRIYGQILSEEGDQEEAINVLIDALRWDSKNEHALLMMGNIFARYKKDIDTALKYYNQALVVDPTNHIAINNIGGNLLQLGRIKEGTEYLEKAYAINPSYPNTLYGLAMAYSQENIPLQAFEYAIKVLKAASSANEGIFKAAYSMATKIAEEWAQSGAGKRIFNKFKSELEKRGGKEIRVEQDDSIPTAAKMEYAENYGRSYHLIRYKSSYPAVEHLMMHELVHLHFALEARDEGANMLFISGQEKRMQFFRENDKEMKRLQKEGLSESSMTGFMDSLYDGINLQVFNTPIDLFIEDYLYERFPELWPVQFMSLTHLINEGKAAVTNKQVEKFTPKYIHTASKVLNMVNAFLFRDLYGVDVVKQFNPLPSEQKTAESLWTEFLEYRKNRTPGEEYELVQHWGEDLKLDKYFELVDEEDFRGRPKTAEDLLQSMEEDPFGTGVDKNFKEKETQKFLKTQEELGSNQAVMWFMVEALEYFKNMPINKVKQIAYEIAMIGTQGIDPAPGNTYKVNSITSKEFSGYHLLAYYYVSWKLAIPEMLDQLRLPFDEEYRQAETLSKSR